MEFQILQLDKHNLKKYLDDILSLQHEVDIELPEDSWYIPSDEAEFIDYSKRGGIILIQTYHNRITAVSSACADKAHTSDVSERGIIIPGNKICYHSLVYVDLEFRGNHTQRQLMGMTINKATDLGYDVIWCRVHPDNIPSVRSIESCGYELFGEYVTDEGWPRRAYIKYLNK